MPVSFASSAVKSRAPGRGASRTLKRAVQRSRWLWLAALSFGLALPVLPVAAQTPTGIEEIVVTARKREENLQDTPLSVSAFSAQMIEDLGISSTDDVASLSPNTLVYQPPGNATSLVASMRGVVSAEPLLTVDSGVALYLDGAYLARSAASSFDLVDLERVEVLRGPQGTLYGRNATGGAINFITRKPAEEFGLQQDFSAGRFGRFESRTVLDTGELGNTGLSASLTWLHQERDGWINDLNASDDQDPDALDSDSWRVALHWELGESLSVDYAYDESNFEAVKDYFQIFGLSDGLRDALRNGGATTPLLQGPDLANSPLAALALLAATPPDVPGFFAAGGMFTAQAPTSNVDSLFIGPGRPRTVRQNDGVSDNEISGHNLTIEFDLLPSLTVKSITTYREWDNTISGNDLDGNAGINTNNAYMLFLCPPNTPGTGDATLDGTITATCAASPQGTPAVPVSVPLVNGDLFSANNRREQEQFSQELQFLGELDYGLNYVLGLYYFEEEGSERNRQFFVAATPFLDGDLSTWELINFNGPPRGPADGVAMGGGSNFFYDAEAEAWAVFGNLNWRATERLELSVGVRYSEDEKTLGLLTAPCGAATPTNPNDDANCPNGYFEDEDDFDHLDYDVSASFALTPDVNVYLRYATAYNSGGFNPRSQQLAGTTDLSFDEEELESLELGLKGLFFDNRVQLNTAVFYSDYTDIQSNQFLAGAGGAASITVNAGQAEFYGFELELVALPTENISLYLNYGYIDMEYDEFAQLDPGVALLDADMDMRPDINAMTMQPTPCSQVDRMVAMDGTVTGTCARFGEATIDIADSAPFSYRPEQNLSAGIEYSRAIGGEGLELAARVDVRWVDNIGTWTSTPGCWPSGAPATPFAAGGAGCPAGHPSADSIFLGEDGYTLLNARLTLSNIRITDEAFAKVSLWGKNITDEEYIRSGIDFAALGFGGISWGAPATYGIDLSFEF